MTHGLLLFRRGLAGLMLLAGAVVWAQTGGPAGSGAPAPASAAAERVPQRSLPAWLMRLHEASRQRTYIGTFVVSSGDQLVTARIWHVCDGRQQMERVESLSGPARATFRHNDRVVTFTPDNKLVVSERRESLGLFPGLLKSGQAAALEQFYTLRQGGLERVAGFEAEVLQLEPRDRWRFAYRIWSEKNTGLVLKLQTLDAEGRVLEQVAFTELQLDAPVRMDKLAQMMARTEGYRVETPQRVPTTAQAEGWALKAPVPGFESMSSQRREPPGSAAPGAPHSVQWVFSDGLASVSLFIEAYDRRRHGPEGLLSMGATQVLAQRLNDRRGDWWLTVVGEVPAKTLQAFAQGLERTK